MLGSEEVFGWNEGESDQAKLISALALNCWAAFRDRPESRDEADLDRSKLRELRIEQIAYQAMDFQTLSKLVLARNWSKFSPAHVPVPQPGGGAEHHHGHGDRR